MSAAGAFGMWVNGEMSCTQRGNWKVAAPNTGPSRIHGMTAVHEIVAAHRGSSAVCLDECAKLRGNVA